MQPRRAGLLFIVNMAFLMAPPSNLQFAKTQRTGTLILVGFAKDGVVMAADGAENLSAGSRKSVEKIFSVGKFGAVGMSGIQGLANSTKNFDLAALMQRCAKVSADKEPQKVEPPIQTGLSGALRILVLL